MNSLRSQLEILSHHHLAELLIDADEAIAEMRQALRVNGIQCDDLLSGGRLKFPKLDRWRWKFGAATALAEAETRSKATGLGGSGLLSHLPNVEQTAAKPGPSNWCEERYVE